jgi:hypothetical protein
MDDAPQSVYDPIGAAYLQPTGWSAIYEYFIKDEIAQYGPITVGFGVPDDFGSFFASNPTGVYVASADAGTHGGHSVAIVGWGTDGSQKYWLVRNSWARDWAASGFFKIEIGGNSAAGTIEFTTPSWGTSAIAPFFKTGSARRLRTEKPDKRRLNAVTHDMQQTNGNVTASSTGSGHACTAVDQVKIDQLRVWFLANQTNYNGAQASSANCSVPWTYNSQALCTARVTKGLQIDTTLHVTDCNNVLYHWTVRLEWDRDTGNVSDALIMNNDGPHPQVADSSTNTTNSQLIPVTGGDASDAFSARHVAVAMMVLLGCFHLNGF